MANIELTLTPASPTGSMVFTLGAPGPQGLAGTMVVGTVTTGAPGSFADIVNVGTPNAAILDFTIPRGDQGVQGDKGDKGDQGDPGAPGVVYADSPLSYDSGTQTISIDLSAYATQTYVNSQGFITASALSPYLTSATAASTYQTLAGMSSYLTTIAASSTYLAKSGGTITGDIQSNNGSGYRAWNGSTNTAVLLPAYLQLNNTGAGGGVLTVEGSGITFASGKQTVHYPGVSILNGYATESWVTGQLGSYLPLAGGAMTGSITSVGSTYDSEFADWGLGVQQSSDHTKGTTVEFNGLNTYDGSSHMLVTPTGLTFPDLTVQTTAYTGGAGSVDWGSITGTLSDQTDLQSALDAKYDASNPAGFVDGSYVNGQGFITQGTADGLYYSISNPNGFITSGDLAGYATESFVTSQGYITASALNGYATESWVYDLHPAIFDVYNRITFGSGTNPDPTPMPGRFWFQSDKFRYSTSSSSLGNVIATESWVANGYASLAGATFTGKVNTVAPTSTNAGINIGSINSTANLTNSVAGDVWIGTWQMAYKTANGTLVYGAATNASNVFGSPQIIDTTNATPALRVTQKGTGNVLLVEDSLNPDATALVVEANGNVGIGVATGYTATQKVEVVGNVKADAFINGTGPTYNVKAIQAHSGGSDTHELLVSVNGSTYRVGMKFVSTP